VTDSASPKAVDASANETPCLARFRSAFSGSDSKFPLEIFALRVPSYHHCRWVVPTVESQVRLRETKRSLTSAVRDGALEIATEVAGAERLKWV
jgi:hypothetical protein